MSFDLSERALLAASGEVAGRSILLPDSGGLSGLRT